MTDNNWNGDSCMLSMYNMRPQLCDVCLVTDDGEHIVAHRIVLASALHYFKAMFTGFGGLYVESGMHEIVIKNIDGFALQQIVKWCYTGSIEIDQDHVQHILTGAKMLDCNDVVAICIDYIKLQLTPENALGIYAFAELLSCFDLQTYSQQYIYNHFIQIVNTEEFSQLSCQKLVEFISSDYLDTGDHGEQSVLSAVISWIDFHVESRHQYLPLLIQHIRFPRLSTDVLFKIEDEYPLLRSETICKDLLIEAMKFHLCKGRINFNLDNARFHSRTPRFKPKCLIVVGGQAPKAIRQCEYYDFTLDKWFELPSELPTRRCRAGLAVHNGLIYAVGGFNGSVRVRTVDCYDPKTNQWTSAPSMEARRSTIGVAVLDNFIYAVGGFDGSSGLQSAEVFNPIIQTWQFIASMSTKRSSVGVATLNGYLYAVGGYDGASRQCLASVEYYNPSTNIWTRIPDMSQRRSGAGVAVLEGKLYSIGGHDGPAVRKSVECYNPETNSWMQCADMIIARRNAGVVTKDGLIYVVGGDDGQSNLSSIEIYNPKINSWTLMSQKMSIGRSYAGVAIIDKCWS